jgi:hypothetical protein
MGLVSIVDNGSGRWRGFAASNGAYIEIAIRFNPNIQAVGWPSVWTMAAEHLYGSAKELIEVDIFEYDTRPHDGDEIGGSTACRATPAGSPMPF